jgi:hypothetical protein
VVSRTVASVYAITIGGECDPNGDFTPEVNRRLANRIPDLLKEIDRLEKIVNDPFVQAALAMRKSLAVDNYCDPAIYPRDTIG